ncbi:uncharacterized protein LOC114804605 [Zeugodacus cucurbitae]|uniref:uncharacterized protein LOC114804605 n=1 Tax=Zeugodacus cucurbitae TaxID=28588 RepID=UPI0023D95C8B|nr:uncharacterized protein LOC114804605 [Zeugodacus cucurbitae]
MFRFSILSALLILLCRGEPADVARIVNDLSRVLGATSNVLYIFDPETQSAAITRNLTLPRIIVTRNVTFNVKHSFNKQITSVVFLTDTATLNHSFHIIVFDTLRRLHHTDVVFYWPWEFSTAREIWLELFTLYWQHGFYNLLVVDMGGQLLTLEPFPQLRVVNTTLESYISQRNNTWRDLKGHRLRISYAHEPSRTLIYCLPETGELQFEGVAPKVFAAFAKRYNATIEPLIAQNSADFNIYHVCRQRLQERLVDGCSDWSVHRAEATISIPLQLYNYYLVVPYAPPLSKLYYFQVPFQAAAWHAIGASIILVTLITTLLTRLQRGEWHFGRLGLDVWASFIYLAFDLRPLETRLRSLIFLTLFVSGFMLNNLYLGYLSSILGKSVYEPQIKTLEDFQRSNLTIMTHENQYYVLQKYGVPQIVADRLFIASYDEYQRHRNNFDTRYAYMNPEISQTLFDYQQRLLRRPLMRKLDKPITSLLTAQAIRKDWPLEELFNKHSLEMYVVGLYKRFIGDANEKTIRLGYANDAKEEPTEVKPLGLEYFAMPAVLLGCGYTLGLIALLLELLLSKMKNRRENIDATAQKQI